MTRITLLLILLAALSRSVDGAPVDLAAATNLVASWLAADAAPLAEKLSHEIKGVEMVADARGETIYYVVRLTPSGFVLVAADDRIEPIVAFGAKGAFDSSARNTLRTLANKDLSARFALVRAHPATPAFAVVTNVSTVAVAPFLPTLWDQTTVGHNTGLACYNYYTPPFGAGNSENYPSGCVATAMGQMMYYFQYPIAGVGINFFGIIVNNTQIDVSLRGGDGLGGPYLWNLMPPVPQNPSAAQCQAIGALVYDAGVSTGMAYTASDSETTLSAARAAMTGAFHYANAIIGGQDNPSFSLAPILINMVNPNLDARLPVMLGIWASPAEGHCALCDGYGYIGGTLYHHLNLGYSGVDNGWYALPEINTDAELNYTNISSCVYNVYASGGGEIVSGRIVNQSGDPVPGAIVTASRASNGSYAATSDANGIYALTKLPSASQYTLTASQAGYASASGNWSTATSQNGSSATGNVWGANFVLTNMGAPAILIAPRNQTALVGGTAGFSVTASGAGALAYQWSRNGTILAAAGNSSLAISNVSAASAGIYSVVVSNVDGMAASPGAVLSVEQVGGAQLAQNGGFETGSFADWSATGDTADTFVTSGALYVHGGRYGAALGPSGSLGFLAQNLATTNGAAYLLSCWLDSPDGMTPNEFLVSWNGTNLFDTVDMGETGWTNLQFLVVAGAASTPLEFGFRNDNSYFGLDDITVKNLVPVPTPPLFARIVNNGAIVLTLTNLTGPVILQTSTDLAHWVPVFTNAAVLGGLTFTDLPPANFPCRYYRAVAGQN